MKKITNPLLTELKYPIGEYIANNLPTILEMVKIIKELNQPVNLWCRGSSGTIIAAIIAFHIEKCVICYVKKPNEENHHNFKINYEEDYLNIIVDDFIATGYTISSILEKIPKTPDYIIVTGVTYIDFEIETTLICQS